MGNRCPSCLRGSADGGGIRGCFGCCSRRQDKGSGINPEDLHSSGPTQKPRSSSSGQKSGTNRPGTLEVKSTMQNNEQSKLNSKFSEFSLHGVQKSSPMTPSTSAASIPPGKEFSFSSKNLEQLFDKYKDGDDILAEGIEKFCNDLGVDPTEYIVLALAWKFKTAAMCKFSREEFINGCTEMKVDSIEAIKNSFPRLKEESIENFKSLYKFAFQFGLDSEAGQRSLPADIAIELWNIVFVNNKPFLLDDWLEFIVEQKIKGVSRDTWNMFLHFTEIVGSDLSKYDDNEAWPSVFDDFVEHYKTKQEQEKQKQLIKEKEIELAAELVKAMNCSKSLEAESTLNNILPPPYDPPPYTSKENLEHFSEVYDNKTNVDDTIKETCLNAVDTNKIAVQGIVTSSGSDISATDVDIPGSISEENKNLDKDVNDISKNENEDDSIMSETQENNIAADSSLPRNSAEEVVRSDNLHSS